MSALQHLRQGRTSEFKKLARKLDDYALRPYLDYHDLRTRLNQASSQEVLAFTQGQSHLPVANILHKRWLRSLGQRRQWQTLSKYYTTTSDDAVNCYHLRALYGTGEKNKALDEATLLWIQPHSQPKACDPLFEVWRTTPRFTQEVIWQRFSGAIAANRRTLAAYLVRFLAGDNKTAGNAFYNAHINPNRISRTSAYRTDNPKYQQLIAHGVTRLAAKDVKKADKAWLSYLKSHAFDDATKIRIQGILAVAAANQQRRFPPPEQRENFTQADTIENLALAAVKNQIWLEVAYWTARLPSDIAAKSQWLYWAGRSAQITSSEEPSQAFRTLAKQRHYYGFLAAKTLGLPGQMNASRAAANNVELAHLARHDGLKRSIELFAIGDDINGRREWYQALSQLDSIDQIIAADLAQSIGLVTMAIRSANIAEANNHLHLRFPVVYEPQFRHATMRTGVPTPLLMAIARQESAMQANARSSADARGLMQLLPSTARLVARRAGETGIKTETLFDPGTNIRLGSFHLAWLINRFGGQTPLAIAAYNAGEHRVDRWIKESENMPMDVWIERIPFRETRNYVKNVLAFRHVYGVRLNAPTPILSPAEQLVTQR